MKQIMILPWKLKNFSPSAITFTIVTNALLLRVGAPYFSSPWKGFKVSFEDLASFLQEFYAAEPATSDIFSKFQSFFEILWSIHQKRGHFRHKNWYKIFLRLRRLFANLSANQFHVSKMLNVTECTWQINRNNHCK